MITRRAFLKNSVIAGAGLLLGLPLAAPGRALAASEQIVEKVPVIGLAYDHEAMVTSGTIGIPADLYQAAVQPKVRSSLQVELKYSIKGQPVTSAVTYDLAELPTFETENGDFEVEVLVPSPPPDSLSSVESVAIVVIAV